VIRTALQRRLNPHALLVSMLQSPTPIIPVELQSIPVNYARRRAHDAGRAVLVRKPRLGLVGLWIDQRSGLLAYAPLYWIVPPCWWITWKRTWPFMIPFVVLYMPAAAFVIGWWA
jgi:hypothetical protein